MQLLEYAGAQIAERVQEPDEPNVQGPGQLLCHAAVLQVRDGRSSGGASIGPLQSMSCFVHPSTDIYLYLRASVQGRRGCTARAGSLRCAGNGGGGGGVGWVRG